MKRSAVLTAVTVLVATFGFADAVKADATGDSITVNIEGFGVASRDNSGDVVSDDPVNPSRAVDDDLQSFYAIGRDGVVTITFLDNTIVNGPGADIRIWDLCDSSRPETHSERVDVDVALGSGTFRSAVTNVTPDGLSAIPAPVSFEICPIDIDLAVTGLLAADRVRITDLGDTASDVAGIDITEVVALNSGIVVDIDIKPGSDSNNINLGSAGVIPVAIFSTPDFNAPVEVDPDTIALAGATVKVVGKGNKFLCHAEDVNNDALPDLVCQVETVVFLIEEGQSVATLEANTFDGTTIRGEDSISIVPDN